ncbi:gamma-glutamyl-gamma-aminobutyrate hydrolase family protein [Pusillibacter faecalis]|uniref:gamma-glutamyl-gamma-aminobutyrate hydrolase family protein n=1 Tax=Pusillibacter faecalis TaxID=2714358 RepID=UPI00210AE64A|nr:gamma-glutamyl-gamma-aminobutyrate hydrolase family protein [Pusillibacter faecalis]MCQ5027009.1 gamma-glutamyl-gamma-aminobutyrate hydrolase family protein [Oscillibacter valericigenes]
MGRGKENSYWILPGYLEGVEDAGAIPLILPLTPLASLLKKTKLRVNNCHHQAIKTLAPGLVEMARSADDLIEVVYLCPARPSLGESSGIRRCPYTLMRPTGISLRRLLVLAKSNSTKGESTELGSVDSPF